MKERFWLTPPEVYNELYEYDFNYDPCPHPVPDGYDGLKAEWGTCSYCNPPFKKTTAWARKCIEEYKKGKTVVYVNVLPVGIYEILCESSRLIPLGRVRWISIETGKQQKKGSYNVMAYVLEGYR